MISVGLLRFFCLCVFFFKQKTAYEMRISDGSSDVCFSDLDVGEGILRPVAADRTESAGPDAGPGRSRSRREGRNRPRSATRKRACAMKRTKSGARRLAIDVRHVAVMIGAPTLMGALAGCVQIETPDRSEEQTSDLQS